MKLRRRRPHFFTNTTNNESEITRRSFLESTIELESPSLMKSGDKTNNGLGNEPLPSESPPYAVAVTVPLSQDPELRQRRKQRYKLRGAKAYRRTRVTSNGHQRWGRITRPL